ncbi:MAG: alpha/beta fold hydrolase, partial [Actinomycetota bacterium]|nr:alpha/beta fold hydrolase [Actinomycetota bacterium]
MTSGTAGAGSGAPASAAAPLPVVIVPGWCCDETSLAPLVALLRRSRPVLVVDLPGHAAASGAPAAPASTLTALAELVLQQLSERALGPCCLVGHSMGAVIALIGGARPDLVAAVVALDPSPLLDQRGKDFFAGAVEQVSADVDGAWRRRFVERLLRRPEAPGAAMLIAGFTAVSPQVAAAECQAIAEVD